MRSFFRRPSWATRGDDNTSTDFYRRSDQTYADIIAASKEARESLADAPKDYSAKDGEYRKRRRISYDSQSSRQTTPTGSLEYQRLQVGREDQSLAVDLHCASSKGSAAVSLTPVRSEAYSLPGSNADSAILSATEQRHPGFSSASSAASYSSSPSPDNVHCTPCQETPASPSLSNSPKIMVPSSEITSRTPPTHEDVTVEILITSRLEHTTPLIVQRRMSQSLKDVRLAWCDHQHLPKEIRPTVYLTWRGKRLFDVTTCRSLGIDTGRFSVDGCMQYGDGKVRVHMEAITDGLLTLEKKRHISEDNAPLEFDVIARPSLKNIVLKCPALPGFGISIASEANVSELIDQFRHARNLPPEQALDLAFDGDRLEPGKHLADYDIADDDLVDVILR